MKKEWKVDWNLVTGYNILDPDKDRKIKENSRKQYLRKLKRKQDEK